MPLYTFKLREGAAPVPDDAGVQLPDREHALAYAKEVAVELMCGMQKEARAWQLDVYEDREKLLFELPFATLDDTLAHLRPKLRREVENACSSRLACAEAVHVARITLREARALVARSRGQPYLAAVAGERTIK